MVEKDEISINPNTGFNYSVIILFILLIILITFVVIKNRKYKKLFIILGILFVPLSVKALTTLKLEIHNRINVEVGNKYGVYYNYYTWLTEEEANDSKYYIKELTLGANDCIGFNGKRYCRYVVVLKDGEYKPGEEVLVKDFEILYRLHEKNELQTTTLSDIFTNYQIVGLEGWTYDYFDTDINNSKYNINYDNLIDAGSSDWLTFNGVKDFKVDTPKKFIMPKTNVLFYGVAGIS